jgi:hypothetical protein
MQSGHIRHENYPCSYRESKSHHPTPSQATSDLNATIRVKKLVRMICFYSEYYISICDGSLDVTAKWNS